MNKAYRAFWTCKGTFGKTWGVKPRVLNWICTVIRPILTYRTMVWWTRVRYNVSRTKLSQWHRLACLAILRAMKMNPTFVMEVLLGFPPLHVMTEVEARAGIYTLMYTQQWIPKSTNFGHTKQSWDMEHKTMLQMGSYRQVPWHAYYKPFTVKFPDMCELQNRFNPDNKHGLVWHTDSFQTNKGNGVGMNRWGSEGGRVLVLGSTPRYSRLKYMPLRSL